jgi:hypothetical protein
MNINESRSGIARLILTVAAMSAAGGAAAQSLRVTATNSSAPNAVYDVLFSPASTTLLNSDGASLTSTRSLVFVAGTASGVDLLVADTAGGSIVRYIAPAGTPTEASTVVWSAASGVPGPQHPDGLSVDGAGNVYAATATPRPAVWVLQPSTSAAGRFVRRCCWTVTSPGTRWIRWSRPRWFPATCRRRLPQRSPAMACIPGISWCSWPTTTSIPATHAKA